jgi:hypothetical protein
MYPDEITFHYLKGQAMQNCGGLSGGLLTTDFTDFTDLEAGKSAQ